MEPNQMSRMSVKSAHQVGKIMYPSANLVRVEPSQPIMLNAWTQTVQEDFVCVGVDAGSNHPMLTSLMEKVRSLENCVRMQSELIAKVTATSSGHNVAPTQVIQPPQAQPHFQQHSQPEPQLQKHPPQQHFYVDTGRGGAVQMHTVINAAPPPLNIKYCAPAQHTATESVNYRIISSSYGGATDEATIEIRTSEEDSMNLNHSADSQRLEICLNDEKPDVDESFAKRIKIDREETLAYHHQSPSDMKPNLDMLANRVQHDVPPTPQSSPSTQTKQTPLFEDNRKLPALSSAPKNDGPQVMVSIGPNNTLIPAKLWEGMSWNSPSISTRKLLMALFERETLATHSMTGKPSPAFKDHGKPLKQMLDPRIVQDIIFAVTHKCNVSPKAVRNAITTKCADENKMMKLQLKNRSLRETNKENINHNGN